MTTLPPQWEVTRLPDGWTKLQVAQRGRRGVILAFGIPAAAWTIALTRSLVTHEPLPLGAAPLIGGLLEILLVGGALWCTYGHEYWLVADRRFETHLGVGQVERVRRFDRGSLVIQRRTSTKFNMPYATLHIVVDGQRTFLCDRSPAETLACATFLSSLTGWTLEQGW